MCRVTVFGPSSLQWICREWVQKLGSDKATARSEGGGKGKAYMIGRPKGSKERGPSRPRTRIPNSSRVLGASPPSLSLPLPPDRPPFLFGWSLLLYTPLFRSSSSYTCQSSMPILKCTSHRPFSLALCELLWPPSPCPGVTSTSMRSRF